jgi:uncharacterized protein
MSNQFVFSPRPNRAAEIAWLSWSQSALDVAAAAGRPVLLNLTAVWSHQCQVMDETTYSDPGIIELINDSLIAVRVDADRYPHVQERYIAGGWPTTAFLTPTGEVLWAGTYVDVTEFSTVAASVLGAWQERREELKLEIGRRMRALEAARGRTAAPGLVRREAADDVLTAVRHAFDPRNGGFGDAPKFPNSEAIELMYAHGRADPSCTVMSDQTLDGMLAGELWDAADGGFFRYATAADWTAPRYEKLLDVNAALLDSYALGAILRNRDDWRGVATGIVNWAEATLARPDGLWAASQCSDLAYFEADAAARKGLVTPPVDATVITTANARWAAALAAAGMRLDRPDWVERGERTLRQLFDAMHAPGGGLYHYRADGDDPQLDFLLDDTLQAARAALVLAQVTGAPEWLARARGLAGRMETVYWSQDGAFWDRAPSEHDVGTLRYRDRPFEANSTAARLLLDLAQVTGERRWRGLAEGTLARIGGQAGRYGVAGAAYALATDEFFEAPPCVMVAVPGDLETGAAQPAASALRRAAFALPVPLLRVWTVAAGHAVGPHRFPAADVPTAYLWTQRGCSSPAESVDRLGEVSAGAL